MAFFNTPDLLMMSFKRKMKIKVKYFPKLVQKILENI